MRFDSGDTEKNFTFTATHDTVDDDDESVRLTFGPDMLSATGEGKWVSYVFRNPESGSLGSDHSGTLQLKNT